MIEIEEIQLDRLVLPSSRIGMVIAQSFIEINGDREPYKWVQTREEHQLSVISRTLEIAMTCDHGCEKTHFTVFPEYSIPGVKGISLIEETINKSEWQSGTVVIAGIDGLTEDQFKSLLFENNTFVQQCNRVIVPQKSWINCCITWVKDSNQLVHRWIQLKLSRAWPELNIEYKFMKPGQGVFLFKCAFDNGVECFFINLICFDWIGKMDSGCGVETILDSLNNYYKAVTHGTPRKIHFVFLLQHNPKPNNSDFLENVNWFFEKRNHAELIDRADSIIVYANSASVPKPGKYPQHHGFSSLISAPEAPYSREGCPPSYAVKPTKLRGNGILGRPIDALFRENAACIHSLALRVPQFVGRGLSDRCLPLECASVHPMDSSVHDPRLPGEPVPAIVKWVNDSLDVLPHLLENQLTHPLRQSVQESHQKLVEEARWMEPADLRDYVLRASADSTIKRSPSKWFGTVGRPNIDCWDDTEKSALETILHALTVFKLCRDLRVKDASAHGLIVKGDRLIDVLIVKDKSHDDAYKHFRDYFETSAQRYLVLVTRDERNTSFVPRSILDIPSSNFSEDPDIRDASARTIRLSFQSLCDCCDVARNASELEANLTAKLGL